MKLVIIGATGPLGLCLVEQALKRNHSVIALVRNATNLAPFQKDNDEDKKLTIVTGNPLDQAFLENNIEGCDAVISAMGAKPSLSQIDLMTSLGPPIVRAMKKKGISRLIICTAMYTQYNPEQPFFIRWVLKPVFLGRNMDDFRRLEVYLEKECPSGEGEENTAAITYTVVKPPGLTNGPLVEDAEMRTEENDWIRSGTKSTPRHNVARFMLDCLDTDKWNNKLVSISI